MPEFLITASWIILFLFFIYRFRFFEIEGIHKKFSYAAFGFKLLLGFANYYIWLNIIGHGDSLRYVHDSDLVYQTLWSHPADYFQLLVGHSKEHIPEHLKYITENLSIEWHVAEYNMVRLLAILNLLSFGSAWGNIAIISFISLIASITLYKILIKYFEADQKKKNLLFLIMFFIPSIVFWSSALLKEGPTLILLSVFFVQLLHLENKFSRKRVIYILITIYFIWLVRDYLLFLILPNLLIFILLHFFHSKKTWHGVGLTIILLISILLINSRDHFFTGLLKEQQTYFLENPADPEYHFQLLDGTMPDLVANIPATLNNIFFRPNLLHSSDPFRIYQAIELFCIWVFVIFILFRFKRNKRNLHTQLFFLFVCLELLLVYGLLVTDADTLSRYRTVPLYFLLILLVSATKPRNDLQK